MAKRKTDIDVVNPAATLIQKAMFAALLDSECDCRACRLLRKAAKYALDNDLDAEV